MIRFLCFPLLLLVALPTLAQDVPMFQERALPRGNPALLQRMQADLTRELQQIQQVLAIVNPNDTQLINQLQAQQAELTRQIRDVTEQLQMAALPEVPQRMPGMPPGMGGMPGMQPMPEHPFPGRDVPMPPGMHGMPPGMLSSSVNGMPVPFQPPHNPAMMQPQMPQQQQFQSFVPPPMPQQMPMQQMGMPQMPPGHWMEQDPAWGTSHWGQRPSPRELTEIQQTVASLRQEIGELKNIIRALETQIQLLNRNILLENARE